MVNFLAVLVAGVVLYLIGMLWYAPFFFGRPWMRLIGNKNIKPSFWVFIGGLVAALVMSYVLAFFIEYTTASTFLEGALLGVLAWLGFAATLLLDKVMYERKPWELYLMNAGHYLVALFIAGGILGAWQ